MLPADSPKKSTKKLALLHRCSRHTDGFCDLLADLSGKQDQLRSFRQSRSGFGWHQLHPGLLSPRAFETRRHVCENFPGIWGLLLHLHAGRKTRATGYRHPLDADLDLRRTSATGCDPSAKGSSLPFCSRKSLDCADLRWSDRCLHVRADVRLDTNDLYGYRGCAGTVFPAYPAAASAADPEPNSGSSKRYHPRRNVYLHRRPRTHRSVGLRHHRGQITRWKQNVYIEEGYL